MVASAQGRDYSSFQKPVTASDLHGLSIAWARVSNWSGNTMGVDLNFERDWSEIRLFGIFRGAYWYFKPSVDPVAQAKFFVAAVKKAGLVLAQGDSLWCDSEVDAANVDAATLAFQREVLALTGFPVKLIGTYSNLSVGSKLVRTSQQFPSLWIAWPSAVAPAPRQWAPAKWTNWTFWQYGIVNGVDADAFNGTAADLAAWAGPEAFDMASFTEAQLTAIIQNAVESVQTRNVLANADMWWLDKILSGVIPDGASPAQAALITSIRTSLQALVSSSTLPTP